MDNIVLSKWAGRPAAYDSACVKITKRPNEKFAIAIYEEVASKFKNCHCQLSFTANEMILEKSSEGYKFSVNDYGNICRLVVKNKETYNLMNKFVGEYKECYNNMIIEKDKVILSSSKSSNNKTIASEIAASETASKAASETKDVETIEIEKLLLEDKISDLEKQIADFEKKQAELEKQVTELENQNQELLQKAKENNDLSKIFSNYIFNMIDNDELEKAKIAREIMKTI